MPSKILLTDLIFLCEQYQEYSVSMDDCYGYQAFTPYFVTCCAQYQNVFSTLTDSFEVFVEKPSTF